MVRNISSKPAVPTNRNWDEPFCVLCLATEGSRVRAVLKGLSQKVLLWRLTSMKHSRVNISHCLRTSVFTRSANSKHFTFAQHTIMPSPARIRHGRIKRRSRSTMRSQFDDSCLTGLTICFGKQLKLDAALAVVIRNPPCQSCRQKTWKRCWMYGCHADAS